MKEFGAKLEFAETKNPCIAFWEYNVNPITMRRNDQVTDVFTQN
jgi:hypothetical protein